MNTMKRCIVAVLVCLPFGLGWADETDNAALARTILTDNRLDAVTERATAILQSGFNAGEGYVEVWIRDFNTFIELACEVREHDEIREHLLLFFHFQGEDGNIVDGLTAAAQAGIGYDYIRVESQPDFVAHKNTVETDQESSLVQAVCRYARLTGDRSIFDEVIEGTSVAQRLDDAMTFLTTERYSAEHGLIWGATTADWGDVQPEHEWGVVLDENSHLAIDIYDNAMFLIALDELLAAVVLEESRAAHWAAFREQLAVNTRKHLWDDANQKFIPNVYLDGSPFPEDFDENEIYYHGGTAVAIEAGLLSHEEVAHALARMRANVEAAGAATIGLTMYPAYPEGFFKNPILSTPYTYQNGGDWTWFGARMIRQLIRHGMVRDAYDELAPMLDRVIKNKGFYEWYSLDNEPRGSGTYRGSAGVLYAAIAELEAWAREQAAPREQAVSLPGGVPLEMVRIPAGAFEMGAEGRSDESPVRTVRIGYDYYLGRYPVTQAQWEAVMGRNPSRGAGGIGPDHPVQGLSWNDAQQFVEALNALELGVFRLPSEAEWEYACRAGTDTAYSFGDDPNSLAAHGWYNANSGGRTHPVGQKPPNGFGLHDMHGNVWEWVQDLYQPEYFGGPIDGSAWEEGAAGSRVLRGGAYHNSAAPCRCAHRNTDMPGSAREYFGLRIVMEAEPAPARSPDPYADETPEERDARMAWWREARFGLFIHWGVYAVPAGTHRGERIPHIGEWIMWHAEIPVDEYRAYGEQFNPTAYDPEEWVLLAKDAGMKYIVITAKHHDGFALFDTKASGWNVVEATPYGKDLLKPLADACRKHGIRLGFYYSEGNDWYHPGGVVRRKQFWDDAQDGNFDEYLDAVAVPQMRELMANYGDVAVLWWDGPGYIMTPERAGKLLEPLKMQPGIITNNRLGGGFQGDTDTPEQRIPATGIPGRDWETCMTMNDTWGYKSYDHNWKSVEILLHNLIDIASKGGNYLLNVGPKASGEIPAESAERLRAIGEWMAVNGEAIHGTTASLFEHLPWGRSTTRRHEDGSVTLYLHVLDWPDDGQLLVPGLRSEVTAARWLHNGETVAAEPGENGWVLSVPGAKPHPIASVLALKLDGQPHARPVE